MVRDMSWAKGFIKDESGDQMGSLLSHTTMSSPTASPPPSSAVSSPSAHRNTPSIIRLKALLRETLRITVIDGRIFLGTFVGADSLLNVLLINTEEFRLGPEENWNGRFVGQVLIPWKLVVKVEALGQQQDPEEPDDLSSLYF
jgi:N-alpha-acetyltransferase 38, NatC auxiliary subunit